MKYKNILVTGGAGFVGSYICVNLKKHYPSIAVTAFDNLIRKGSELNLPRLEEHGVIFIKGDVRNKKEILARDADLIIDAAAEPSVLAGVNSSPEYVIETNLLGAYHCFELARIKKADVIFLSTSRVYPIHHISKINTIEEEARFTLDKNQTIPGVSKNGITESFPLDGARSLYGSTKLSAELLLKEYIEMYKIRGVIDRFGLITGPWQMGKVDQGVIVLWMARHYFKKKLTYEGFGGTGKQVRDMIDIEEVFDILLIQLKDLDRYSGEIYNIGGGVENSISLSELTKKCEEITGNKIEIEKVLSTRPNDVKIFISDNTKIEKISKWKPKKSIDESLKEIYFWIKNNEDLLKPIFLS